MPREQSQLPVDEWWNTSLSKAADPRLRRAMSSDQFNSRQPSLTNTQRGRILSRAALIIASYYAHLPMKRSLYAIDPLQRLKLLQLSPSLTQSDYVFYGDLLSIFASLCDLHTRYMLPALFRRFVAMLPFRVAEYSVNGRSHYIVAGLADGFAHSTFEAGVDLHYWSGVPISRAVSLLANRTSGANYLSANSKWPGCSYRTPTRLLCNPS